MKRIPVIVAMLCALVLSMGLVACGGSSGGSSGGAATSQAAASATQAPGPEILPEYLDEDGGITLNAVLGLSGPDLVTLMKDQGYEWDGLNWANAETGDLVYIRGLDGKTIKESGYSAAAGTGELAEGYIQLRTTAREIIYSSDLVTVRDAMLQGYTVEDEWLVGGGAYLYSVVADAQGERAILLVIAYDQTTADVEFSTDAYLVANDDGGVDGVIELWRS